MIIDLFLQIFTTILNIVLTIVSPILDFTADISGIDISGGIGYVFGNAMLLNGFLPVSEFFSLAVIALTFKLGIFGFQVLMFTMHFLNKSKRLFIHWRV